MNSKIPFIIIVFCQVKNCVKGILKSAVKGEPDIIMHKITYENEMSLEEACDVTNESLRLVDCSPLKNM